MCRRVNLLQGRSGTARASLVVPENAFDAVFDILTLQRDHGAGLASHSWISVSGLLPSVRPGHRGYDRVGTKIRTHPALSVGRSPDPATTSEYSGTLRSSGAGHAVEGTVEPSHEARMLATTSRNR